MTYLTHGFSPTREYEVHMLDESGEELCELITLPENLNNSPLSVSIWYAKYIPVGCLLVDIVPFEEAENDETYVSFTPVEENDYVGFGDSLDYVGPEPEDDDGFTEHTSNDDSPKEESEL